MITKSDLCWVLVRTAGVYFIYSGIAAAFGVIIGLMAVRESTKRIRDPEIRSSATTTSVGLFLGSSVLPLAVGIYLLSSGRSVHRCLMTVPDLVPGTNPGGERKWMGLAGAELTAFYNWLGQNPELKSLPPEDQVARFRDSQRPSH